jgi:hypothetical protein
MNPARHDKSPFRCQPRVTLTGTACLLAIVLPALPGCTGSKDPYGRLPLAGTVTFQGQPLAEGIIEFLPSDPNQRLSTRTLVSKGKYQVPREQGVPPGTYRVLISSPDPSSQDTGEQLGPPGMKMPPPAKERIPARYNRQSRVTVDVQDGGANTFDFRID